jgi:tetratricopeptide (TPR) repeat protein
LEQGADLGTVRFAGGLTAFLLVCALGAPAWAQEDASAAALAAAEAIDTSGQPAAAEAAWREVIALEEAGPEPRLEVLVTARSRIGDSLYYRGRPDLAQRVYEDAVALIEAASEAESDLMSETLANLGTMLTGQGRPLEDIEVQRRALAIRTRLHGPDDPRLATNYFNLGNALHEAGLPIEAAENVELGARLLPLFPLQINVAIRCGAPGVYCYRRRFLLPRRSLLLHGERRRPRVDRWLPGRRPCLSILVS